MKKRASAFYMRGFISILMAFCFAGLAMSGIVMYFTPPLSVASVTNWTFLALAKEQWASLHQVSALFILVLAMIHLFIYNWKPFLCYLRRNQGNRKRDFDNKSVLSSDEKRDHGWCQAVKTRIPRELMLAIIVAVILYAGAISLIAPFGWLYEGRDVIKENYQQGVPAGTGRGSGFGLHQEPLSGHPEEQDQEQGYESGQNLRRGLGREQGLGRGDGRGAGRGN
ncbi:MAG: DUF4405 domain-containing protein [Balneolales bacterium]